MCSEESVEPEVCKIVPGYTSNYPSEPHPIKVQPYVTIFDVINVDPRHQTLTMIAEIILFWTDLEISFSAAPNSTQ